MPAHHRRLRLVIFGDGPRGQRHQVLRDGFEAAGHEVVLCAPPPRSLLRTRRLSQPDAVIAGAGRFDVFAARLRWPRSRIVHDLAEASPDSWLQRRASSLADLVVVGSDHPSGHLATDDPQKLVPGPVGAPSAWFRAAEQLRALRPLELGRGPMRVISLGCDAHDKVMIAAVADRLADHYVEWTLVGTDRDHRASTIRLDGGAKVTWLGREAVPELPALVADHDVFLGTFGPTRPGRDHGILDDLMNAAAAGCAVVTTPTPRIRRAFGEAAVFVPPSDPDTLTMVLAQLAADPRDLERCREAATARATQSFLPTRVTQALLDRLADGPAVPF